MQNGWADNEFYRVDIWDNRCKRTLIQACQKIATNQETSFSRAVGSQRKAVSRIIHHASTTPQSLLEGHVKASRMRCLNQGEKDSLILVASDTTLFDFTSHSATEGLGPIHTRDNPRGFLTHTGLALSIKGVPLGILHQQSWVRQSKDQEKDPNRAKESEKWLDTLHAVQDALPAHRSTRILLVQDREADVYSFFSAPRRSDVDLLIRATQPRRLLDQCEALSKDVSSDVDTTPKTLFLAVAEAPIIAHKSVTICEHPNREGREAHLTLRHTSVLVLPPKNAPQAGLSPVLLHVVRASEESPPEGVKVPVEWVLLTTMNLPDSKSCLAQVEYYSYRWRIERFHYVLKSGCTFEKLQLDSFTSLSKVLSVYSVVAWKLLHLMYLAREVEEARADEAVSGVEAHILELATGKAIRSAREALRAIAWLGGFRAVPSAPTAGVKSLWIGYRKLATMLEGYLLAHPDLHPTN